MVKQTGITCWSWSFFFARSRHCYSWGSVQTAVINSGSSLAVVRAAGISVTLASSVQLVFERMRDRVDLSGIWAQNARIGKMSVSISPGKLTVLPAFHLPERKRSGGGRMVHCGCFWIWEERPVFWVNLRGGVFKQLVARSRSHFNSGRKSSEVTTCLWTRCCRR